MQLLSQLVVNGIFMGSIYIILGLGLGVIWSSTGILDLSYGGYYVAGAYLVYVFAAVLHLPMLVAILLAVFCVVLLAGCLFRGVYYRLLTASGSTFVVIAATIGMLTIFQNLGQLVFGAEARFLDPPLFLLGSISIGGVSFTVLHLVTLLVAGVLVGVYGALVRWTPVGKAIKAVAGNPELAEIIGFDNKRVHLVAYALGGTFCTIGAALVAMNTGAFPQMGMMAVLMASITVKIGGVGSLPGVIFGGLLLGIAQNVGVWKIPTEWQSAIAFLILIIFLLVKPTGLFGQREWKAQV